MGEMSELEPAAASNTSGTMELDWVKIREDLDRRTTAETFLERAKRKTRENPFVPIGCVATVAALCYGVWSFYHEDRRMSQYMMRARVAAQGFTIVAALTGIFLSTQKKNK